MSSKDMMADILESEKNLVVNMATSLNEASCDSLYKKYFPIFQEVSQETKQLFAIAYSKSWYQLEEAPKTKITKEHDKLNKDLCA